MLMLGLRHLFGVPGGSGYSSATTADKVAADNKERIAGKVFVVTGSSAGIGLETAKALARQGGHVIMACRPGEKAQKAYKSVVRSVPNGKVELLGLDLSSFESIREFAEQFKAKRLPLHVLINNAGLGVCPRTLTRDGHEAVFGTNHLGHFLLTNLLVDLLQATGGQQARVVNVASEAHRLFVYPEKIPFDDLKQERAYGQWKAYGMSKLCNVLHAKLLNDKLQQKKSNVTAYSVHPGGIITDIGRHASWGMLLLACLFYPLIWLLFKSIPQGAATTVFCAVDPRASADPGMYFADCNIAHTPATSTQEYAAMGERLWDVSAKLTNSDLPA
eukprot:GDKI01020321.1.p1 GENE.GDKI01020321.1~~GDKI01020321.1.p1  ORF type:complete len:331 (+),score=90.97 GDKI01020321.1:183-1175(+)